jgi:hypothetical protein
MQIFDAQEPPSPEAGGGAPVSGSMIGGKSGGGEAPVSVPTEASSPATASGVEAVASSAGTPPPSSEAGGLPGEGPFEPCPPPLAASGLDEGFSAHGEPVVLPEAHAKHRAAANGGRQLHRNLIRC